MENEKIRCAIVVYKLRNDIIVLDLLCGNKSLSDNDFVTVRSQLLTRYPHKKLSSSFVISIFHLGYSAHPGIQPLSLNAEKMKNGIRTYYNIKYGYDNVSIYFVDVDNKYVPF